MEEGNKFNDMYEDDLIDIGNIVKILWIEKVKLIALTTIFAVMSVLYALNLPNIYTSSALLAPAESKTSGYNINGAASIASLAGINLPMGDSSNKSIEAIERIKTFDFFVDHFLPYIKYEDLVASESWNSIDNTLNYNNLFDSGSGKWTKIEYKPSNQQAFKKYIKSIEIIKDNKTSFVTISFSHHSPDISKNWLEQIIKNINKVMQDEDIQLLSDSVNFLNNIAEKNNLRAVDEAITNLMETQIQNLMLATANADYVYKVIDSPVSPEEKSSPQRSIISILGTLIGLIVGICIVLVFNHRVKSKS